MEHIWKMSLGGATIPMRGKIFQNLEKMGAKFCVQIFVYAARWRQYKFQTANFPIFCAHIIVIFWTTCIAREVFSLVIMGNGKQVLPVLQWLELVIAFVSSFVMHLLALGINILPHSVNLILTVASIPPKVNDAYFPLPSLLLPPSHSRWAVASRVDLVCCRTTADFLRRVTWHAHQRAPPSWQAASAEDTSADYLFFAV